MAKRNMINRELKRSKLAVRYAKKRDALRTILCNTTSTPEEKEAASIALQKLPRDSARTRQRNRCKVTGRSRGIYRKFGLSRHKLREAAMRGEVPGLKKASW